MQLNLRGKILAYLGLPVVAVLGTVLAWSALRETREELIAEQRALALRQAAELDARLREIAQIATRTAVALEVNPTQDRGRLFDMVRRNVIARDLVYGAAIAFAPGISAEGRLFSPYAYRGDGRELKVMDIASEGYDYTAKQWQWWHRPLERGDGAWTDVYEDTGAGNVKMVTYSAPFRWDGKFAGVATVDVQLPNLREMVLDSRARRHKMFVIGADERMVFAHHSAEIGVPLAELTRRLGRGDLLALGRQMLREAPGVVQSPGWDSREPQWISFAPVHATNWVLGLRMDRSAVLAEVGPRLWSAAAIVATVLVIVAVGLAFVAGRISRPLVRLDAATRRIAQGDRSLELATDGGDEIARLSRSFNDMTRALVEREQALVAETAAREKIESELALARELQRSMLPPGEAMDAALERYEIAAALEPARAVGGDFFDYVATADGRLVFVVADVSDKGVPAALFMVRAHTLMRSLAPRMASPSELLAAMNDALCADNERCMFVTLACGALDLAGGRLALSSAGHEPPLRVARDGTTTWLETEGGPALGLMEGMAYPVSQAALAPGDALVLYTDGISEAFDSANEAFGRERLEAAARGLAQAKALDLCAGIFAEVRRFVAGAEQSDDITLLVVRWHGGKG